MNDTPREEQPVDRGSSEEASGAPLTPTEEETLRRPAGVTPGVTPGTGEEDSGEEGDAAGEHREGLNPDD
ncbi:hypothetical protein E1267_32460 [Nonomuraea longispora]|uniref:Uncharacterized protein n=1 Tax=Nonomuraea longispora TaxID=1848320 RepID=A0A4R4N4W0_9ACTN|nr:hypothetical protein [Nonomuraea longispora]TDC01262.1 hypothetical protein E1267_32460 [Nonomuraea longispora]